MMPQLNLATVITLSTVRLSTSTPQGSGSGTGFLFRFDFGTRSVVTIITNKHVAANAISLTTRLTVVPKLGIDTINDGCKPPNANHIPISIPNLPECIISHPSPDVDLCAINISNIWVSLVQTYAVRHTLLDESWMPNADMQSLLRPIEPIVMVGYPKGLSDETNNLPVIRNGITGSHPMIPWNGSNQFLVDAACFPGSSGSPVFLFQDGIFRQSQESYAPGTQAALLGILYAGPLFEYTGKIIQKPVPTLDTDVAVINTMMNLGYVINSQEIIEIKDITRSQIGVM